MVRYFIHLKGINNTQVERLPSLPQNQGSWHSAIVDDAGCRLTPVMW